MDQHSHTGYLVAVVGLAISLAAALIAGGLFVRDYQHRIDELDDKYDQCMIDASKTASDLQMKTERLAELERRNDDLQDDVKRLEGAFDNAQDVIADRDEEIRDLTLQNMAYQRRIEEAAGQVRSLNAEVLRLKGDIESARVKGDSDLKVLGEKLSQAEQKREQIVGSSYDLIWEGIRETTIAAVCSPRMREDCINDTRNTLNVNEKRALKSIRAGCLPRYVRGDTVASESIDLRRGHLELCADSSLPEATQ